MGVYLVDTKMCLIDCSGIRYYNNETPVYLTLTIVRKLYHLIADEDVVCYQREGEEFDQYYERLMAYGKRKLKMRKVLADRCVFDVDDSENMFLSIEQIEYVCRILREPLLVRYHDFML